jgi:hypothetical protein
LRGKIPARTFACHKDLLHVRLDGGRRIGIQNS